MNSLDYSFGEKEFEFEPSHPIYIKNKPFKKPVVKKQEATKKPTKKKIINRLFSLPFGLIEKIYEYDDTYMKIFEETVLCKTRILKYINHYNFYKTILYNRRFKYCNRKKYCELIVCSQYSSWFTNERNEYPFPYDLIHLNSRHINGLNIQKSVYEYRGERYYFIRCEMEINEFVKSLYRFLLHHTEDSNIEILLYLFWEDEYERASFIPTEFNLNSKLGKSKYRKIMINGDAINNACNLILFSDKNEEGKDVIYIQVEMDYMAIVSEIMHRTGNITDDKIKEKMNNIYNMRVYDVIQVVKKLRDNKNYFSSVV